MTQQTITRAADDAPAVAADLVAVLVFVLLGRSSHHEGGAVAGTLATAWPFVVGALDGWLTILVLRRAGRPVPAGSLLAGASVLAGTVVLGMVLRRLFTDGGTSPSFVLVATGFLALFVTGWRVVVRLVGGREAES